MTQQIYTGVTMQVDPTDDDRIEFDAYDSMDIEEFDAHFNPALLYEGGRVPPGVRVVGVRRDEHEAIVVLDGPGNPGAPVPSHDVQKLLVGLLRKATEEITGCDGIVVDVQTERVYAASLAALLGCVSNQEIPGEEKRSGLGWAIAFVPGLVRRAAKAGSQFAHHQSPLTRAIGAILCIPLFVLSVTLLVFMHEMSILPVYEGLADTPGLSYLAGTESTRSILGFTFSIAGGVAVLLPVLQIVGLVFNRDRFWNIVFAVVLVFDTFFHTHHWDKVFEEMVEQEGAALVVTVIWKVCALIGGIVTASGWEVLAISTLVIATALLPALWWGILRTIEGTGLAAIATKHEFGRIFDRWEEAEVDQRAMMGPKNIYQGPNGNLNPSKMYLWAIAAISVGVLIVIAGIVFAVVFQ
jgi:hypothetical protein